MNTDQGSQYTGTGWITTLTKANIKISMPPSVCMHEITDGFKAKQIIDNWLGFYNSERPHTALDKRTPDTAYFDQAEIRKAA
jgi:putative transposase